MHQTFSHSESYGAVHNPYDFNRGPGGSSGGNGALMYRDRRRGPIKLKTLDLPSIEEQTKIVADAASQYVELKLISKHGYALQRAKSAES